MRRTRRVNIHHEFDIEAHPEEVWRVVGDEFADVGSWVGAVPSSTAIDGPALEHAPVAGRQCDIAIAGFGALTETITEFDPNARRLAYRVDAGMPRFVGELTNNWALRPGPSGTTHVTIDVAGTLTGLAGLVARRLFAWNIRRSLRGVESDLCAHLRARAATTTR